MTLAMAQIAFLLRVLVTQSASTMLSATVYRLARTVCLVSLQNARYVRVLLLQFVILVTAQTAMLIVRVQQAQQIYL